MKKYLALLLALMMLLACAACGSKTDEESSSPSPTVASMISVSAETGEGFACLVLDDYSCYWEVGLSTPTEVETYFSIKVAPRAYIQFVPIGDSDDPISDPDAVWQMQVIGEIPDWFEEDEEMQQVAWNALAEWRAIAKTAEGVTAVNTATIAIDAETGEGFACVLMDNGEVFWQKGINSAAQIVTMNDLRGAPMALIQVVQVGDGDDDWQIQIIDEIPDWFEEDENMEFAVRNALAEWIAAPESDASDIGPVAVDEENTDDDRMFACVLMDNGDIYWQTDVTLPSELVEINSLSDAPMALIQVVHLPGDIWQMQVIGEVPDWLGEDNAMQQVVWGAFNQWKEG